MPGIWPETRLEDADAVFDVLAELRGKRWLSRGQAARFDRLEPTIDRDGRQGLSRIEKIKLERRSIERFRSGARFFTDPGEERSLSDDLIALMVLRHNHVPTRLLDWTLSPWVAAFFACEEDNAADDEGDGAIWCFDQDRYEVEGREQWSRWPETCRLEEGKKPEFDYSLTAFLVEEPPDWFVCYFYPPGFPRQRAQQGFYSMTARFGRDHAESIGVLLGEPTYYHRYVIDRSLKSVVLERLRTDWGLTRASLYPDPAGAADWARLVFASDDWRAGTLSKH
jgi:hypothetical protein